MSFSDSIKLTADPDVVTFETMTPIIKDGVEIPTVRAGYMGKVVANLYQYLNSVPSKENIQFGQWFALPVRCDPVIYATILAITPAGQSLEELKAVIVKILKD